MTGPGSESSCTAIVQKGTRTSMSTPTRKSKPCPRTVALGDRLQRPLRRGDSSGAQSLSGNIWIYVLGAVLVAEGLVFLGLHPSDSVKGPTPALTSDFTPLVLSFLYSLREPRVRKLSPASEVEPTPRGDETGHVHRGLGDVPRSGPLARGGGAGGPAPCLLRPDTGIVLQGPTFSRCPGET